MTPRANQFNNKVSLGMMVVEPWKDIMNMTNQRNKSMAHKYTEMIQMACAVDVIHKVWMALLESIPEDVLHVGVV
jgi:hypothetical protein